MHRIESFLGVCQVLNERAIKDGEIINARYTKLQQDFETQLMNADDIAKENQTRVQELKVGLH